RDLLALDAPYLVVEQDEGVFQLAQARARGLRGLVCEDEVSFEPDHAHLKLAHLALEGEEPRAVLGHGRAARRDELARDDALALRGHAHPFAGQRQLDAALKRRGHPRAHLARERPAQHRRELPRRGSTRRKSASVATTWKSRGASVSAGEKMRCTARE